MVSLSFFPIATSRIYTKETPEKLRYVAIDLITPYGINTIRNKMSMNELTELTTLINDSLETWKKKNNEYTPNKTPKDTDDILSNLITLLKDFGITIEGREIQNLWDNYNFLCFISGHGTKTERLTLGGLITLISMIIWGDLVLKSRILSGKIIGELLMDILSFSASRSRIAFPFALCLIYGKLTIETFGILGQKVVSDSAGRIPWPPGLISIIGFTGIWINTWEDGRTMETWFFGASLGVIGT